MGGIISVRPAIRANVNNVAYAVGMASRQLQVPSFYNVGAALIGIAGRALIKDYRSCQVREIVDYDYADQQYNACIAKYTYMSAAAGFNCGVSKLSGFLDSVRSILDKETLVKIMGNAFASTAAQHRRWAKAGRVTAPDLADVAVQHERWFLGGTKSDQRSWYGAMADQASWYGRDVLAKILRRSHSPAASAANKSATLSSTDQGVWYDKGIEGKK